ncbi:MAG: cytochrome c [Sphingobacteriaceae bacterium]|nr:cytochrome c [Sphingobacteriaceae bacterium]
MKISFNILGQALIASTIFLYACGGGDGNQQATSEETSSASSEAASTEQVAVDPEAKSESKGVGRFTSVEIGPLDKSLSKKGEAVFTAKCSACHKLSDEKIVGPGLKNVTLRRTPEWIMNMITNPEEMTKQDPVGKALFEKHLVQMTFQNVSDDETRQILEFLRDNDAK